MAAKEARLTKLLFELSNRPAFLVVIESFLSVLITLVSIAGNAFVLLALYRSPRLKKPSYLYIASLALSDIIMSSAAMPFTCISVITGRWFLGKNICWLQASFATMLGSTSLLNMSLIAADRFLKVVYPNRHRKFVSVRSILTSILAAWCITAAIPLAFYFTDADVVFHPGHAVCLFDFSTASKVLLGLITVFGGFLPYQVIFICYFKVWRFIRTHNSEMNRSQVNTEEVKLNRLFIVIIGAFTLSFTPFSVITTIDAFREQFSLPRQLYFSSTILIGMASCVNPVIYGVLNSEFRREFMRILRTEKLGGRVAPSTK